MTKILIDEATVKLVLEALEKADRHCPVNTEAEVFVRLSITALREALAEQPAPMIRGDIRDGLVDDEPAMAEQTAQKALDKMAENARELGLDYEPVPQEPVCGWKCEDDDHMPGTWRSDCGVMWTFTDGGPVDNDMKYCCGCGAMLLEKP